MPPAASGDDLPSIVDLASTRAVVWRGHLPRAAVPRWVAVAGPVLAAYVAARDAGDRTGCLRALVRFQYLPQAFLRFDVSNGASATGNLRAAGARGRRA